jgi:hypothetical protein
MSDDRFVVAPSDERSSVGLCAGCAHAHRVVSARGSVFWLCRLASSDPAFPRYPRLPVLRCPGFEQGPERS